MHLVRAGSDGDGDIGDGGIVLAIVAPGQGAQRPGFLAEWLELPGWRERLGGWSEAAGVDLLAAGRSASAEEIRDTAVAQPLLVAAALASAGDLGGEADVLAGHSVGEFAVAALAGVVPVHTALALVRTRATAMAQSCHGPVPTGMSAVIGGDQDAVIDRLTGLGLEAANRNGAGQIVAAGRRDALERLAAEPPLGARVRALEVAGAFHTPWMSQAQDALAEAVGTLTPVDPHVPLVGNADGAVVHSGRSALSRLVVQVTSPVRFDSCLATLRRLGVTGVVELLPGGTLASVIRRELPDAEVVALRRPRDLARACSVVVAHSDTAAAQEVPSWRLIVAGSGGRFARAAADAGTAMLAGAELGALHGRSAIARIVTPYDGVLVEWLAEDGDPISPGQPLARLQPRSSS